MKKYENYKDSGLEWLGMVPEHWEVMPIKYVLEQSNEGIKIGPFGSALTGKVSTEHPVRVYGQWNVVGKDFNAGKNFVTEETYHELSSYQISANDILISMMGTVGKCAIIPETADKGIMDSHIVKIRLDQNKVLPEYFYYIYDKDCSKVIIEQIQCNKRGSIMDGLNSSLIKNFVITLPPLSEQRTIASYLDQKVGQIDALISEKEKMVEDLKAYRSSLITETVTKGLDKGVEMKDSGDIIFKSIPQHWNLIPIKYLTSKVGSGVTPTGGANVYLQEGIIFLRSQNIYPTGLQLDDVVYISEAIDNNMAATRVNKGDVLLNITGASIGRCFTYNRDERANVNQHVCIVRPKQTLLNGKYLQYLFNSNAGQNFINSVQNGTNREGLNFEQIKNFSVPVPSLDEQQTIIKFLEEKLSKIDALQIELEHQLSDLKSYKSSLITEAVTGKIDLRDWQTKKS